MLIPKVSHFKNLTLKFVVSNGGYMIDINSLNEDDDVWVFGYERDKHLGLSVNLVPTFGTITFQYTIKHSFVFGDFLAVCELGIDIGDEIITIGERLEQSTFTGLYTGYQICDNEQDCIIKYNNKVRDSLTRLDELYSKLRQKILADVIIKDFDGIVEYVVEDSGFIL